jgi:hypothetical protein
LIPGGELARRIGEVLVDAGLGERGFFVNPCSIDLAAIIVLFSTANLHHGEGTPPVKRQICLLKT